MGAWGANIINFPANQALAYYEKTGYTAGVDWLKQAFAGARRRGFHVENLFTEVMSSKMRLNSDSTAASSVKRESSAESSTGTSDTENSPSSSQSWSSTTTTFIYEDPSKDYYDTSSNAG